DPGVKYSALGPESSAIASWDPATHNASGEHEDLHRPGGAGRRRLSYAESRAARRRRRPTTELARSLRIRTTQAPNDDDVGEFADSERSRGTSARAADHHRCALGAPRAVRRVVVRRLQRR